MGKEDNNENRTPDPGIFVTKGMRFNISELTISIGEDGNLSTSPINILTSLDMCPYWLNIAYAHLLKTDHASNKLMLAKENNNDEKIGLALESEFVSGMQAIVSACIAIDSYYASVKDHVDISDCLVKIWHKNNTARYGQIAEVFKRAFSLRNDQAEKIRDILKECFYYRDKAVHPNSETSQPVLHVELNKITDWRFVTFRFFNAKAILSILLILILQTSRKSLDGKNEDLKKYCASLIVQLKPLTKKWEKRYGKLS